MSVCPHTLFWQCAQLKALRKIPSDHVKRQICGNIKLAFFFKLSYSKVRAFFLLTVPRDGRPSLVDAYSACNVSYTLRYMFAYA